MDLELIKKSWTLQFYKEFEDICFTYRISMRVPLITVVDFSRTLGQWDKAARTLSIATRLILNNPWDLVLEVFKHEMAHQYVDEVLGVYDQHGPYFKKACSILGVDSWAQKAEVHEKEALSELKNPDLEQKDLRVMRKIQALLALSKSSNEHEALLAMQRVQDLYEKYQIENLIDIQKESFGRVIIDHKKLRLPSYHRALASLLTSYFSVKVIFSTLYDKERLKSFKVLEILGKAKDVKLAEYVYWFLYNTLKILWDSYQKREGIHGLSAKHSFYSGILDGFEKKLERTQKRKSKFSRSAEEKDLMLRKEKEVEEYMHYKFPRLRTVRSYTERRNAKIFQDGREQGKELTIHEGLSSQGKTLKYIE